MIDENLLIKKRTNRASIVFLGLVILITIVLYIFNNIVEKEIIKIDYNTIEIENKLIVLNNDDRIYLSTLIDLNQSVLSKYDRNNKVVLYINNFKKLEQEYNIFFHGFDLSSGKIKSIIKTQSTSTKKGIKTLAYQKVSNFISSYRLDENSLFELGFINLFRGNNKIDYNIIFNLK